MTLHCDNCDKPLGDYLYGSGGIEERAAVGVVGRISLPDITCFECLEKMKPPMGLTTAFQESDHTPEASTNSEGSGV